MARAQTIGLVLAGGGARGAYEAGALSVLLPELERRGQTVRVLVGTSVGALSCAFLGAAADRSAQTLTDLALERWRSLRAGQVFRSPVERLPVAAAGYLAELLALPGARVRSLLDTAPLRDTLDEWIDWSQLRANVRDGAIEAVAVVATAARDGRSVVFLDSRGPAPPDDARLRYVRTPLTGEHVRASAAIPILFPPVRVTSPATGAGWYLDGGTRLNAPIRPALDLGVDRVVVIAMDAVAPPDRRGPDGEPTFGDAARHLLDGVLVDPLIEDVRALARVNRLVRADAGGRHRTVPYILVAPRRRGAIGELAAEVLRSRYGGLRGLRAPGLVALTRLLGGTGTSQGALLSLLLFEPAFIERLIQMGARDARRRLDAATGDDAPWRVGPPEERPVASEPEAGPGERVRGRSARSAGEPADGR